MDGKTLGIVKAAWAMFARYGFAKTTMSDIAREAGVARQTVYNAFDSKDAILRAVVRMAGEQSLVAVQEAWADANALEDKLEVFQRLGPQSWYEAVQAAPDWEKLMDGLHRATADELVALEDKWVAAIRQMLIEALGPGMAADRLQETAEFLYSASKTAKYGVTGVDQLKQRLSIIRKATLALLRD